MNEEPQIATPLNLRGDSASSNRCSNNNLTPLAHQSPVLPITFRRGDERFSYFSLITTVGTPQCVTASELQKTAGQHYEASLAQMAEQSRSPLGGE
jgi:hypothetical protein